MSKVPFITVFLREVDRVASRRSTRNLLFWVPVTIYFFLAFIYIKGGLNSIPVAVYDADNSYFSRTIVRYLDAAKNIDVREYLTSGDHIENYFLEHPEIHGVFVIPKDLYRNVLKGEKVTVSIYTNSTHIVFGNILKKEAMTILTTISSGVMLEKFKAAGLTHREAMNLVMPVSVHTNQLFNPYYNYLYYLVPGLLTVLLGMIMFFVATRALNSEVEEGSIGELYHISNGSIVNILAGKTLAYTLFGMIIAVLTVGVVFPLFEIPVSGNLFRLYMLLLLFVEVNIFMGFFISALITDQVFSLDVAFVYNSPAFVFSGFTFPRIGMPAFHDFYAGLLPYSYFMTAFFKIYQMNVEPAHYRYEIFALLIFLVLGLAGSYVVMRLKLRKITFI